MYGDLNVFYFSTWPVALEQLHLHLAMQYFRCEQVWQSIAGRQSPLLKNFWGHIPRPGCFRCHHGFVRGLCFFISKYGIDLLFIPFPIKAKWMVLIMVGLDLFGGFSKTSGDNVAHFAHLGGAITGFIIVFIWNKTNRKTLY